MYRYQSHPRGHEEACCSPRALIITAIVLLTIGGIIAYIGVFSPYLAILDTVIGDVHAGFYTLCGTFSGFGTSSISCGSLWDIDDNSDTAWLRGCQIMGVVASICALVGWIMLLCWLCQDYKTQCMKVTILIFLGITIICYVVSLIIWAAKYDDLFISYDISWGYGIAWAGTVMIIIAAVLVFFYPTGYPYPQQPMMAYGQPVARQQPMMVQQPMAQPMYQQPMQMKPVYQQSQMAYSNPAAYGGYSTGGYPSYR